jgi:hypothetical protein
LVNFSFTNESSLEKTDDSAFSFMSVRSISIPERCQSMRNFGLSLCCQLHSVEFHEQDHLETINLSGLFGCRIEEI